MFFRKKDYIRIPKLILMLVINVKENESIEKALKRFKKKFQNVGVLQELRDRKHFEKHSVSRRKQIIKAAHIQKLRSEEESGS